MVSIIKRALPVIALAGLLAGCGAGTKSGSNAANTMAPPPGTVIAVVNGQPLTSSELNAYVDIRTRGSGVKLTPEQSHQVAQELVQVLLASQDAKTQGLENKPDVQAGLVLQRDLYLANQAVQNYMSTHKPTDQQLQQKYQDYVKSQSGEEYKARHILVKTKAEADQIIDQLNKGADFATLAKKDSIDTASAKQGGELGWFKSNQMVSEFSDAVAKLKPGEYTKTPVHTQYGWHVILLEKERTAAPPSFTAMKPVLTQQSQGDLVQNYIKQLQSQAKVTWKIPNPASAAAATGAASNSGPSSSASASQPATSPSPATH